MAELRKVRNIKPGFKKGLWFGLLNAGWETVSGGLSPWTLEVTPDWSSLHKLGEQEEPKRDYVQRTLPPRDRLAGVYFAATEHDEDRSEEHTSELQSLMRISYAVFCLKKKKHTQRKYTQP